MKRTILLTALLITSVLAGPIGYAGDRENKAGHQCMEIADPLHNMAMSNRGSVCADDIEVASAYIEAAGNALYREKNQEALRLMYFGARELGEISNVRLYCQRLAIETKNFLGRVLILKNEIAGWHLKQARAL